MRLIQISILVIIVSSAYSEISTKGGLRLLKKVYDQCDSSEDVYKCLKIQALKIVDRALHTKSFGILEGVRIVRDEQSSRSMSSRLPVTEDKLQQLDNNQVDTLLSKTAENFLESHRVQVNLPKLVEEGRGKMKKYIGPLILAMTIKGGFMAMAFKGIAVMAGTALLIGKLALVLSSIIGLKKLVSSDGGEKTTFEIVKHPHVTQSHSYSTSHYGGYEDGGHYHRSLNEENRVQERAYRAHVPGTR